MHPHSWQGVSTIYLGLVILYHMKLTVVIQIAGMDPLRDEGIAYAEALEAAG